jgi:hypothetical protein
MLGRSRLRIVAVLTVLCILGGGLAAFDARAWDTNPLGDIVRTHDHQCGADDLPEQGIQGDVSKADQDSGRAEQGYNCGLALVGYTSLGFDGRPNANANLAWAGHCAYIAGSAGAAIAPESKPNPPEGAGVAVVSVADDGSPTYVATLRSPGALATAETLNAVTTPSGRSILVVGQYGNDVVSDPKPMDVYDVSDPDCSKAVHLTTYYWPGNIHNLTLSQDGNTVFATIPLQAADISGLWDADPATGVTYLGNIEQAMDGPPVATGPVADLDDNLPAGVRSQTHPQDASHEAWPSPDANTLYVGGQTPEFEILSIIDISQWRQRDAAGNPLGPPRVISQESGRGHSVRTASIGGKPYLLHSEEGVFGAAYGCIPEEAGPFAGPAEPWLTPIDDAGQLGAGTHFGLEINDPANCGQQMNAGENDSVHYHDVDDPANTTFVMASMWNAGIRLFDVRDPKQPAEVAYFNPGDVDPTDNTQLDHAWGHIRYLADRNQIWFATADGGFWVVRIESQVLHQLGLDTTPASPADDRGHPGTAGAVLASPIGGYLDITPYYCTLGALGPA